MSMSEIVVPISEESDPNFIGEYLLEKMSKGKDRFFYNVFTPDPGWERVEEPFEEKVIWSTIDCEETPYAWRNPELGILAFGYWDGDGSFWFFFEGLGLLLENPDIKKASWNWRTGCHQSK